MAAVVNILSLSENHTWLTWEGTSRIQFFQKRIEWFQRYVTLDYENDSDDNGNHINQWRSKEVFTDFFLATLVDIVMRKGWPIAITAWPAKVNQNLTKENVKESTEKKEKKNIEHMK